MGRRGKEMNVFMKNCLKNLLALPLGESDGTYIALFSLVTFKINSAQGLRMRVNFLPSDLVSPEHGDVGPRSSLSFSLLSSHQPQPVRWTGQHLPHTTEAGGRPRLREAACAGALFLSWANVTMLTGWMLGDVCAK